MKERRQVFTHRFGKTTPVLQPVFSLIVSSLGTPSDPLWSGGPIVMIWDTRCSLGQCSFLVLLISAVHEEVLVSLYRAKPLPPHRQNMFTA